MSSRVARGFLAVLAVAPTVAAAQSATPPATDPISLAVLPLPDSVRSTATVLGYRGDEMVTLRQGTGDFVCLADQPGNDRFHVACYHKLLEPFMARGRALRKKGIDGHPNLEKRWEEIDAGTLAMPRHPVTMHQLFGRDTAAVAAGDLSKLTRLTVIYMAYATAEDTGLPASPGGGIPWMMYSGKPTAHVMISN